MVWCTCCVALPRIVIDPAVPATRTPVQQWHVGYFDGKVGHMTRTDCERRSVRGEQARLSSSQASVPSVYSHGCGVFM